MTAAEQTKNYRMKMLEEIQAVKEAYKDNEIGESEFIHRLDHIRNGVESVKDIIGWDAYGRLMSKTFEAYRLIERKNPAN